MAFGLAASRLALSYIKAPWNCSVYCNLFKMDEHCNLRSSESLNVDTSPSPRRKFLPSFNLPTGKESKLSTETNNLSSEMGSRSNSMNHNIGSSPGNYQEIKLSKQKESRRSSLCRQFDPLHSYKNALSVNERCHNVTARESKTPKPTDSFIGDTQKRTSILDVQNLSENVLMSFESPKKLSVPKSTYTFRNEAVSKKMYTEEELRQILQAHELHLQGEFMRKHHDLETSFTEKDQTLESELLRISKMNKSYFTLLSEITHVLQSVALSNSELEGKIKSTEVENERLKNDVATFKEDIAEWENTFSEFHKRYEQCKSMLKTYKENEVLLQRSIGNARVALGDKNKMFEVLEPRAHKITDKAQKEIESMKKSAGSQIAMLEAQLKISEMKIHSLEKDFSQARLQHDELDNIYNELMLKIGK